MPPPNTDQGASTLKLRKGIAKEYCRTVLWLDDEIKPDAEGVQKQKFLNFFVKIAADFSNQHILCQLKDFPQIKEDDDPYADADASVNICIELAKKADILLLDWHLGESNPKYSIKLLRALLEKGGNRFVVILSQEPELKKQFEQEFNDGFQLEGEWYRHKNGLFALLLNKASFEKEGSGKDLIDKIYDQLAVSYPDYLHWAAIETAGRIKALAHAWLSRLPVNTDIAVLAEKIHAAEDIEETILENLLDDLRETITLPAISCLSSESLNVSNWLKLAECQKSVEDDLKSITDHNKKTTFQNLHPVTAKKALDLKDRKTFRNVLENHKELTSIQNLKASVDALGEFTENVSIPQRESMSLRPGAILQRQAPTDPSEILVCISQGCDCIRADNLLFLRGVEDSKAAGEAGETFLQFSKKRYLFKPRAENLVTLKPIGEGRQMPDFSFVGLVRQHTLGRLISRFWAYSTRIGINQPRFVRDSRKETPL